MPEESSPGRARICRIVDAYVAAVDAKDTDAIVAMFTDDAELYEPWGVAHHQGSEQIRSFYAAAETRPFSVRRITPITVVGNRAVMMLAVTVAGRPAFASTDIFEVDGTGRFTSMRALPDPEAVVG